MSLDSKTTCKEESYLMLTKLCNRYVVYKLPIGNDPWTTLPSKVYLGIVQDDFLLEQSKFKAGNILTVY